MQRTRVFAAAAAALAIAACSDPVGTGSTPSRRIEDAVHNYGNIHFYWLQPTVATTPVYGGTFNANYHAKIELCEFENGACVGPVMTWNRTGGPLGTKIYASSVTQSYTLSFSTAGLGWQPGKKYRAKAIVLRAVVGLVDLYVTSTHAEAAMVDRTLYYPVVDGDGVTLTFRMEDGLALQIEPKLAGTLSFLDGAVVYSYDVGSTPNSQGVWAQPAAEEEFMGDYNRLVYGTIFSLGPDNVQFLKPVTLSIAYDPADLPGGVDESSLHIVRFNRGSGGYWSECAGSAVDLVNKRVSCPITASAGVYGIRYAPRTY
jgi:hypothetical protein